MNPLAVHLSAFLREHLPCDRRASPHTTETYAYAFELLVCFAAEKLGKAPSTLDLARLDAQLVLDFLRHLERERGNSPRTRNARLAAIKAFFRFLEYRDPRCLDQSRAIHAIPMKRCDEPTVDYLTGEEVQALLDAPDLESHTGLRDRAMLHLAFSAGLRVSELVGLQVSDLVLHPHVTIHVRGKGRRERTLPLWKETTSALRQWLSVRKGRAMPGLFLNARGTAMSRAGFEYLLAKHVKTATGQQPSLAAKRISPHVLRHSCAMHMLHATHDIRKVALWLGHAKLQSTEVYLRADPNEKLESLMAGAPPELRPGHFRRPDKLLSLLQSARKTKDYAK
jgi:site-specific recombinase XerD